MKAAALLSAALWAAAQGPARFTLAPSSEKVQLGAPFEITGEAVFPPDFELAPDLRGQDSGSFEVLELRSEPAAPEDGFAKRRVRMKVAAFGLGRQTLPSLRWALKGKSGASGELRSPPVRVEVLKPEDKPGDSGDIRDIRPPLSPSLWLWLLAAALLATACAVLLERRLRGRRRPGAGPAAAPDARKPHEIALAEIEALAALGLPVKESYERLSAILRVYLERRFGMPALKMTTLQLQRAMIRAEVHPGARSSAKALLERCDLVKFARLTPAEPEVEGDRAAAKEIVVLTKPVERPAQPPAAGGRR